LIKLLKMVLKDIHKFRKQQISTNQHFRLSCCRLKTIMEKNPSLCKVSDYVSSDFILYNVLQEIETRLSNIK
jgi:hypothetical protein